MRWWQVLYRLPYGGRIVGMLKARKVYGCTRTRSEDDHSHPSLRNTRRSGVHQRESGIRVTCFHALIEEAIQSLTTVGFEQARNVLNEEGMALDCSEES